MTVRLTRRQAELILAALENPSVTDPEVAALYEKIQEALRRAKR